MSLVAKNVLIIQLKWTKRDYSLVISKPDLLPLTKEMFTKLAYEYLIGRWCLKLDP